LLGQQRDLHDLRGGFKVFREPAAARCHH